MSDLVLYPDYADEPAILDYLEKSELVIRPPFKKRSVLTFGFGMYLPIIPNPRRIHTGLDIGGCAGKTVFAPCKMFIRKVGNSSGGGGYIIGEVFDPCTPESVYLRFFHFNYRNIITHTGDYVEEGEPLGKIVKSEGHYSTGVHLHIDMLWGSSSSPGWKRAFNFLPLCDGEEWATKVPITKNISEGHEALRTAYTVCR